MKYYSAWDIDGKLYSATIDNFENKYHVYFSRPNEEIQHIMFDSEIEALTFALDWIGKRH